MEEPEKLNALRAIPPVNVILSNPLVEALIESFGRPVVLENIKFAIEEYRKKLNEERYNSGTRYKSREEAAEYIIAALQTKLKEDNIKGLKKVINATGIVLHTNLGRAPLPKQAIELVKEVSEGYCNLEFDLISGSRGSRHSHIEELVTRITGAESAIIVNNNAAAVFLTLNTLADSREVIVSRGQQVEIGGSFRIPDIINRSGAKMIEVGTTNKTRISDYLNAVTAETALLLKVHTSNYKVTGFTEEVQLYEMAELAKEKGLVVMEDLGSGSLYDLADIGLPHEPTVQESINSGADLVTFSGDKLLGGPQAGIIAGKKNLIDKIKKNPLLRMLRCDKTTIAALAAVLNLYIDMDNVKDHIPALKMMALKEDEMTLKAEELENMINKELKNKCQTEITDELDEVGGGSLPGVILRGKAVAIKSLKHSVNEIQEGLRKAVTPVICRINKGSILLNVRTIDKEQFDTVVEALARVLE